MKGKRRLHHESLEARRLLAANCQPLGLPAGEPTAAEPLQAAAIAEGEHRPDVAPELLSVFYNLSYGPDLIQEDGNKVFVVDQPPYSLEGGTLFVFERTDSGTLETVAEVELEFPVEQMVVNGDQVVLIGNNFNWFVIADRTLDGMPQYSASVGDIPDLDPALQFEADAVEHFLPHTPRTVAVTVNLGSEVEVIRQEFEGLYHQIHHEGDRIVMVSSVGSDATIAIYPPPLVTGMVTTYDITGDGLSTVASAEIPLFGLTSVHERDFYAARDNHSEIVPLTSDAVPVESETIGEGEPIESSVEPMQPTVVVSRYVLGEDSIEEAAAIDLGPGFLLHFEVSADGQTAVAVRSEFGGAGPVASVDLLDLSSGSITVFESILLADFSGQVLVAGPDYVVLRNYENNLLAVIDANQEIDVDSESRVRRIELPDGLRMDHESLQVSEDLLLLRAERTQPMDPDGVVPDVEPLTFAPPSGETILLTVSLSEAAVVADISFPDEVVVRGERLFLIDPLTQRFGLLVHTVAATGTEASTQFLFGRVDDSGEFLREGTIAVGRWLEIDADAERLLAREADRLLEYDWSDPEEPTVTPLGEPEPAIEAIDDEYTLFDDGEDHLLEVLANDAIHRFDFGQPAQIVELAGAPSGAEILDGQLIRIPADALEGVETLRFEYVISDGQQRSSAVVEIDVLSIAEEDVEELIEAVQIRAAEDFGVRIEEIEITYVERIFTEPLPVVLPGEPEIDLSPGILVTLRAPNGSGLYAASLDGEIIQVLANRQEDLVELGLRATDNEGNTLETVAEGDNFWLEFNAKDLRQFGLGVYAAFFDLVLPTENLVVTGPIEYGPGFTSIPGNIVDEGEIDDLGAIGDEIEAPGNERQQILRIGVRAIGAGDVTLQPGPADARGTETLLRGRETELPVSRVRYTPLSLTIVEAPDGDPLDADGNGRVSAADALVVINFLGRFGSTRLEDLAATLSRTGLEGEQAGQADLESMRRYDTTGDGMISALDALVVINGLTRLALVDEMSDAEGEEEDRPIEPAAPLDGLEGSRLF